MKIRLKKASLLGLSSAVLVTVSLTGCLNNSSTSGDKLPVQVLGSIQKNYYDGQQDDLLTAGLGASGLAGGTPAFDNPEAPTAAELRRNAIYANYRALVPTDSDTGYGRLFGPTVGASSSSTDGKIAGHEWLALVESGEDGQVTLMVQVPDHFDTEQACMVTAPSSGSRGIYGAIGTAGEWGLKKGCAVIYTDKGTGTGAHNLAANTSQTLDGQWVDATESTSSFSADISDADKEALLEDLENPYAFRHAHSGSNPESRWGNQVLDGIQFGFYALNQLYEEQEVTFDTENTLVIASSVSNGGGASVLALEKDTEGLIDALVVSEPNVNPKASETAFSIDQGDHSIMEHGRSLLDYTSALALYQGCANRADDVSGAPLNLVSADIGEAICDRLYELNLVEGSDTAARAADAQRILNEDFALVEGQNFLQPGNYFINVPQSIAITYANAYGGFGPEDKLCGFAFSGSDDEGKPQALDVVTEAALFATSNGIPPTGGVNVIYLDAVNGPTEMSKAVSPGSGQQDYALDGFICLRELVTGKTLAGDDLTGERLEQHERIQAGIDAIRAEGHLRGKPAIFVSPRDDQIIPINHGSRSYVGLNAQVEGSASGLKYYEALNTQHLDILNAMAGFNDVYVPLHYYFQQSLDLMYSHLREGTELPPSQVVRPSSREQQDGSLQPLSEDNLPAIAASPASGDQITITADRLSIPD